MVRLARIMFFICPVVLSSCATFNYSSSGSDVELLATGYRQLIQRHEPQGLVFLSGGFDSKKNVYLEANLKVFEKLKVNNITFLPVSAASFDGFQFKERATGREGIMLAAQIRRRIDGQILLRAGYLIKGDRMGVFEYSAKHQHGQWILTDTGNAPTY